MDADNHETQHPDDTPLTPRQLAGWVGVWIFVGTLSAWAGQMVADLFDAIRPGW